MNEDYHYEIPLASEEELKIALEVEELRKKLEQIRNDPVFIQKTKEIIEANREVLEARQKKYEEERRNPTYEVKQDTLINISKAAGEALMFLELDPSYAGGLLKLIRDAWSFEEEE